MTISSTNRKAGPFIGAGTVSTFPFAFKVFQPSDMLVVKVQVSTNIETTLTLTTDYSVTLNADQNSSPGGNIVLTSPLATGYNMVISSQVAYTQQTDLTNQGGFYPEVITNALDRLTIEAQQLKEGLDRAAQLPITSSADAAALVADIERIASSADNLDTVATNIGSVNTVAADIADVTSVAANISNVNAVAANETNIDAVVANATNINAVAGNATNINTVAGNNANVTTVAGISSNVTTVAGIAANVTSVAGNATNINAVAGNATNINAVNANSANINAVAGNATNINTVSSNTTNINTTATNIAAIIDAPNQAAAAASSAAAAAASAASGMYSAVQDKSANYTVVAGDAGDLLRINTSGGVRTITLPAISTVGDGFKVAIVKWTSDANAVTVARSGSDTINGATSYTLGNQYSSATFVADLETAQWFAVASGLGVSNTAVDVFSGNGSTTAFTLSGDPGSKNNTMVEISGVYQAKATYSISGTTLTFSTAPPTGTSNIEVVWTAPLAIGVPSDGSVSTAKIADGNVTYAKMQSVTAGKVLGRDTSGSGVVQELPIAVDASGNVGIGTSSPTSAAGFGTLVHLKGAYPAYLLESTGASRKYTFGINSGGSAVIYDDTAAIDRLLIDSSGNLKFNSGYGSPATAYGCRAWVNFNGQGTPAIRGSGNVSSITDNGVGDYGVNFTSAMPDTNYTMTGTAKEFDSTTNSFVTCVPAKKTIANTFQTTNIQVATTNTANGGVVDCLVNSVVVIR